MEKTKLVIDTYNYSAENYIKKFMKFDLYNDAFDRFVTYLTPKARIIDIACGPGNVAKYLLDRIPSLKLTGIDLSKEMIKLAREHVPSADFFVQDIRDMSFDKETFDGAIAAFCLPYLYHEETKEFFKRLRYILKRGA